ncbi:hypothetical protein M885DRAFT_506836 [Pelagophyceae sp. CCMP2097]|nr:hypothetical protein M885DRAFT_506836 [Pelagophyceae sp. CCMP2097]|mmetsp:Transcript_15985/g.53913  ORF Transcript_15985/g.53913 Transcript_15985/m.53913 type:complete len:283 (+) Transcript_15985:135-983(+)
MPASSSARGALAILLFNLSAVRVAGGGKIVVKAKAGTASRVQLRPTANNQWQWNKVTLAGEYDFDEFKYAPASLSLGFKESVKTVPYAVKVDVAEPFTTKPKPVASLAIGPEKLQVVLDSKCYVPKKVSAAHTIKQVGLKLMPSWSPRSLDTESKGLELKTTWELNGPRAVLKSVLAPYARPKCDFSFELDAEGTRRLNFQPLLGEDAKLVKYTVEQDFANSPVKQVAAELYANEVSLKAKVPVSLARLNLAALKGSFTPTLVVPLAEPKAFKFSCSQQFDF